MVCNLGFNLLLRAAVALGRERLKFYRSELKGEKYWCQVPLRFYELSFENIVSFAFYFLFRWEYSTLLSIKRFYVAGFNGEILSLNLLMYPYVLFVDSDDSFAFFSSPWWELFRAREDLL